MNELRRRIGLALAFLLLATGLGFAQSDTPKPPLSEVALMKLVKSDLEEEVIVTLINKRGIAFKADDDALDRLKEAGASKAVLAAVRAQGPGAPAKAGVVANGDDGKVLATAEHPNGLIVEVLEVNPDANRPLLTIKWRYRNSTKDKIELIGRSGAFRQTGGTPRTRFVDSAYFLAGGKDDEAQYRHSIVSDDGGKLWCKQIGLDPVYVPAGGKYDFWAKFELPVRTSEKISLSMGGCPRREQLALLLAEKLTGPEAERLEAHVRNCTGCQQALDTLGGATTPGGESLPVQPMLGAAHLAAARRPLRQAAAAILVSAVPCLAARVPPLSSIVRRRRAYGVRRGPISGPSLSGPAPSRAGPAPQPGPRRPPGIVLRRGRSPAQRPDPHRGGQRIPARILPPRGAGAVLAAAAGARG